MPNFSLEKIRSGDALFLRPQGYLDELAGQQLRDAALEAISQGVRLFILNFEKTTVIYSPGITQILELAEDVVYDHKSKLALVGVSSLYSEVFQVVGLTRMVEVFPSEEAALART